VTGEQVTSIQFSNTRINWPFAEQLTFHPKPRAAYTVYFDLVTAGNYLILPVAYHRNNISSKQAAVNLIKSQLHRFIELPNN
jgi:hypothetical protein